jgi:hypothetical protein
MRPIMETLNLILEDQAPTENWGLLQDALDVHNELEQAKLNVQNLMHQLHRMRQKMCVDLAYRIRKFNPSYNVNVDKNGCKIGYRRKVLHFKPDIQRGMWIITSKDGSFASEFRRANKQLLLISPYISQLIQAIDAFFKAHYKTLHEEIVGEGTIIINEQMSTLADLIKERTND